MWLLESRVGVVLSLVVCLFFCGLVATAHVCWSPFVHAVWFCLLHAQHPHSSERVALPPSFFVSFFLIFSWSEPPYGICWVGRFPTLIPNVSVCLAFLCVASPVVSHIGLNGQKRTLVPKTWP